MYPINNNIYTLGTLAISKVVTSTSSFFSVGNYQQVVLNRFTKDGNFFIGKSVTDIPGYSQGTVWASSKFIDFIRQPLFNPVSSLTKFSSNYLALNSLTQTKLGSYSFSQIKLPGIIYKLGAFQDNSQLNHRLITYSGLNCINPVSPFNCYFGPNATQDNNTITIYKRDLPGLIPQIKNHAESILAALYVRAVNYPTSPDPVISSSLYRWEVISNKNLEKVWIVTDYNRPATDWEINYLTDDMTFPLINPMDYGD